MGQKMKKYKYLRIKNIYGLNIITCFVYNLIDFQVNLHVCFLI